ncbi:MAG TPA: hypothetical protein VKN64_03665 [Halanaerobiales bacterium]|nr:hypothetical protein [Halanaerobiales bacterium]
MRDRFVWTIIKNNWRTLLISLLIIIIGGIIIKNVGEIPYEDQHLMNSTTPIQFNIDGNEMRGFIYLSYWVEAEKNTENMTSYELGEFLQKNGYIELDNYKESLIETLKTYEAEDIKENWMNDYEFFKKRNVYFIEDDEKLMDKMEEIDVNINLKYQLKKIFFVYLDQEKYNEFVDSIE